MFAASREDRRASQTNKGVLAEWREKELLDETSFTFKNVRKDRDGCRVGRHAPRRESARYSRLKTCHFQTRRPFHRRTLRKSISFPLETRFRQSAAEEAINVPNKQKKKKRKRKERGENHGDVGRKQKRENAWTDIRRRIWKRRDSFYSLSARVRNVKLEGLNIKWKIKSGGMGERGEKKGQRSVHKVIQRRVRLNPRF